MICSHRAITDLHRSRRHCAPNVRIHNASQSGEARPKRAARGFGLMCIPDLCILECEISAYYKLMNVIITRESMYSFSACVRNAIDKQYDILDVSVVNTGCALSALSLPNGRERKSGGNTFLSPSEEQRCHHALAGRQFANYSCSFKLWQSKVARKHLCAFIHSYDVSTGCS